MVNMPTRTAISSKDWSLWGDRSS